ncbi:thiol peroxidase [Candidatus Magnetaquicoccus inordinatus]|uniref:thiol peroxidase n=1 Tax=Candidatus Magnetaquicoccus inordinatus TaxID=2496818 RepID=UPI00102C8E1A|nr:thiol peroxidase [Candidatus Magnetaquicoccus inordinatus]
MAQIAFKGNPIHTCGELPAVGSAAPDFCLTGTDLADVSLQNFAGKRLILNIFPSVDTGVCAASVRRFNSEAAQLENTVVLCISVDLPFAHKRFCGAEGISAVQSVSEMRARGFAEAYGVRMVDGPLAGLMSRAVVVINGSGQVVYTQQVPEIVEEPNYADALAAAAAA